MATIVIDVDETTKDALAKAAANVGETLAEYLRTAAADRMVREEAARYSPVLSSYPSLAAELAVARRAASQANAVARASVLAKYCEAR